MKRVWWIVSLAVAIRFVVALFGSEPVVNSDFRFYWRTASNIMAGHGYSYPPGLGTIAEDLPGRPQPTAIEMPATSYALAGARLLIHHWSAVLLINIPATILLVWSTAKLGAMFFPPVVGEVAALAVALYPEFIVATIYPNSDLPFIALIIYSLTLTWPMVWPFLVAAYYFRPLALIVPAFSMKDWTKITVMLYLFAMPWLVRNLIDFQGEGVLATSTQGTNMLRGLGHPTLLMHGYDESDWDDAKKAEAFKIIKANPLSYPVAVAKSLAFTYSDEGTYVRYATQQRWLWRVTSGLYCLLVALGIIGFIYGVRPRLMVGTVLALGIVPSFIALGSIWRWHLPIIPLVMLWAAHGAMLLLGRGKDACTA